jgi:hypothetical protein
MSVVVGLRAGIGLTMLIRTIVALTVVVLTVVVLPIVVLLARAVVTTIVVTGVMVVTTAVVVIERRVWLALLLASRVVSASLDRVVAMTFTVITPC